MSPKYLDGDKVECPFCGKRFKGRNPAGELFGDLHINDCPERTPPNIMSLPVQETVTVCLKCGGTEFTEVAHHDLWFPRRAYWEYACKSCGQHHTALASRQTIATKAPFAPQRAEKKDGGSQEPVEVEVAVVAQGQKAVLVTDGDKKVWVPYSLIDEDSDIKEGTPVGALGTILIPAWKAKADGLM